MATTSCSGAILSARCEWWVTIRTTRPPGNRQFMPRMLSQYGPNRDEAGYDGIVSIEHEDSLMSVNEGLTKAIEVLQRVLLTEKTGGMWWA